MKELITTEQANTIMLALIVVAPIIGFLVGRVLKQPALGLKWGVGIGLCNFALWKVYNTITDSLGLDTVKNLLVNLALFIVIGLIGGMISGLLMNKRRSSGPGQSDEGGTL
jgi:hypothetical protein